MKTRILNILAVLAVTAASMNAAKYDFVIDGSAYTILPDRENCVEMSYSNKELTSVEVPDHISVDGKDYTVVSIGEEAFSCRYVTTSVVLPNTIETIGKSAFNSFPQLRHLKLPESVDSIAIWAFSHTGLRFMVIPDNVRTLAGTMPDCENLHTVVLGKGMKTLNGAMFENSNNIKELYIMSPEPLEIIEGSLPFYKCESEDAVVYVPAECLDKYPKRPEGSFNAYVWDGWYKERKYDRSWEFFKEYRPIPDLFIVIRDEEFTTDVGGEATLIFETVNYADVDIYSEKWEYDPEMISMNGDRFTTLALGETIIRRVAETSSGEFKSHDIKVSVKDFSGVSLPTVDPGQSEPAERIDAEGASKYYSIDGIPAGGNPDMLRPGVYIERCGNKTTKFIKR